MFTDNLNPITVTLRNFFSVILVSTLFCSCSTVHLSARKDKDIYLHSDDFLKLEGNYCNQTNTNGAYTSLFQSFIHDTSLASRTDYYSEIVPVNNKLIKINFCKNDSLNNSHQQIKSISLKGQFKDGYFKVKREYPAKFIVGPLVWVFGERQHYLGLTKNNKLVILNSGGKGAFFITIVPFFIAGGDAHEYEYGRIE